MSTIDIGEGQEPISEMEKPLTRQEQASLFPRPAQTKEKVRDLTRKEVKSPTVMEEEGRRIAARDGPINSTFSPLDVLGGVGALGVRTVPRVLTAIGRGIVGNRSETLPPLYNRPAEQYGPLPNPNTSQYVGINGNISDNQSMLENFARLLQKYPRQAASVGQLAEQRGFGGLPAIERYVARRSSLPLPE